jgi:hypothetical protein
MMTKEDKDLQEWERFLDLEIKLIKLQLKMLKNGNIYYEKRRNK